MSMPTFFISHLSILLIVPYLMKRLVTIKAHLSNLSHLDNCSRCLTNLLEDPSSLLFCIINFRSSCSYFLDILICKKPALLLLRNSSLLFTFSRFFCLEDVIVIYEFVLSITKKILIDRHLQLNSTKVFSSRHNVFTINVSVLPI